MLSLVAHHLPLALRNLLSTPCAFHVSVGAQHVASPEDLAGLAATLTREVNHVAIQDVVLLQDAPGQSAAQAFAQLVFDREQVPSPMTALHPAPILVALPLRAALEAREVMEQSVAAGISVAYLVSPAEWREEATFLDAFCGAAAYRDARGVWCVPKSREVARRAN